MSDVSVSPTPSQENRSNTEHEALDALMSVQEQSYSDFVDGFAYLKKEDINKQILKKKEKFLKKCREGQGTQLKPQNLTPSTTNKTVTDSDDLEVEMLGSGTRTSVMNNQSEGKTVKFDNFIDAEGSDPEDVAEENGYVASFGEKEPITVETIDTSSGEVTAPALRAVENSENNTLIPRNFCRHIEKRQSIESMNIDNEEIEKPIINPGEVDDETELSSPVPVTVTDRRLNFTASYHAIPLNQNGLDAEEVCSDAVEAFSLDENFDYDNVVLTPKFSVEEIQFLRSLNETNVCPEETSDISS